MTTGALRFPHKHNLAEWALVLRKNTWLCENVVPICLSAKLLLRHWLRGHRQRWWWGCMLGCRLSSSYGCLHFTTLKIGRTLAKMSNPSCEWNPKKHDFRTLSSGSYEFPAVITKSRVGLLVTSFSLETALRKIHWARNELGGFSKKKSLNSIRRSKKYES